jgi:hypothetical protein
MPDMVLPPKLVQYQITQRALNRITYGQLEEIDYETFCPIGFYQRISGAIGFSQVKLMKLTEL